MIKIILAAAHINYDAFLERMLEMAREHPEMPGGMKLPPFTGKMLKMLPADKKNDMIIQALNGNKEKILPQAEQILSGYIGPVRIRDLNLESGKRGEDEITAAAEFSDFDSIYLTDYVLPLYYSEDTAYQMLGEDYNGSLELSAVQNYIRQQEPKQRQLLFAKSLSANKAALNQMLEHGAQVNGIELKMDTIRVMVK